MLLALGQSNEIVTNALAHSHEAWEIALNIFGKGESEIGGKVYPFDEGTIICIPPSVVHNKTSEHGFRDYFMHVDVMPGIDSKNAEPIILQDDSEHTMEKLMGIMLHMMYSDNSNRFSVINSLHNICTQLITEWNTHVRTDPAVERIQNLLISGYSDPELDLNTVLASTGYSAEYLRKKFKQETGVSPLEYLTNLRITNAKNLLEQKKKLNLSVKEISLMCGFYDSHYFSTAFRKSTGMTPKDYALQAALDNTEGLQQKVIEAGNMANYFELNPFNSQNNI